MHRTSVLMISHVISVEITSLSVFIVGLDKLYKIRLMFEKSQKAFTCWQLKIK